MVYVRGEKVCFPVVRDWVKSCCLLPWHSHDLCLLKSTVALAPLLCFWLTSPSLRVVTVCDWAQQFVCWLMHQWSIIIPSKYLCSSTPMLLPNPMVILLGNTFYSLTNIQHIHVLFSVESSLSLTLCHAWTQQHSATTLVDVWLRVFTSGEWLWWWLWDICFD